MANNLKAILKLKPHFVETIWGGTYLKKHFNYDVLTNKLGECWLISAHPRGETLIENEPFKGQPLSEVYLNNKDLFALDKNEKFPLLVKLIDAKDDLSVQVHPGDEYAKKYEDSKGKSEAWLILHKEEDAQILVGHNAQTKEELTNLVMNKKWDELLTYRPLEVGEIINIPSGTVHAIQKGTVLLEVQQSSDVTYRLYDHDRIGKDGLLRPLHLKQSLDVISVPHLETERHFLPNNPQDNEIINLIKTKYFMINLLNVNKEYLFSQSTNQYYLVVVLDGEGMIGSFRAKKGESYILTSVNETTLIKGNLNLIIATT